MPLAELRRRGAIMFSGDTGAVVASGDSGVTSAPTYKLVEDVVTVIKELEKRTPALFDPAAHQRTSGECRLRRSSPLVGGPVRRLRPSLRAF